MSLSSSSSGSGFLQAAMMTAPRPSSVFTTVVAVMMMLVMMTTVVREIAGDIADRVIITEETIAADEADEKSGGGLLPSLSSSSSSVYTSKDLLLPTNSNCSGAFLPEPLERRKAVSLLNLTAVKGATLRAVGGGLGTTATHAIHNIACAGGMVSMHWTSMCNMYNETTRSSVHKVLDLYQRLKGCTSGHAGAMIARMSWDESQLKYDYAPYIALDPSDRLCDPEVWRQEMRSALVEVVTSGVEVLTDVPYPYLIDELVVLVPDLVIMQTLRDADTWAQKRFAEHGGADTMCRRPGESATQATHGFHIVGCSFPPDLSSPDNKVMEQYDLGGPGDGKQLMNTILNQKEIYLDRETYPDPTTLMRDAYAHFNSYIVSLVPTENIVQLCAWDGQFEERIAAGFVRMGVIDDPSRIVKRANLFPADKE